MADFDPYSSGENVNTGFGVQANAVGDRFVNKDGSFNITKTGSRLQKNERVLRLAGPFRLEVFSAAHYHLSGDQPAIYRRLFTDRTQ